MKRLLTLLILLTAITAAASDVLTATATPMAASGSIPFAATFVGTATSSLSSPITSWTWNFGELPVYAGCIGTSATALKCPLTIAHTYTKPGTYTIYFTATDLANSFVVVSTTVTVTDSLLTASISLITDPLEEFQPISFKIATFSTRNVITSDLRDCNDGRTMPVLENLYTTSASTVLTVSGITAFTTGFVCYYTLPGTYLPSFLVTDSAGQQSSATTVVVLP